MYVTVSLIIEVVLPINPSTVGLIRQDCLTEAIVHLTNEEFPGSCLLVTVQ